LLLLQDQLKKVIEEKNQIELELQSLKLTCLEALERANTLQTQLDLEVASSTNLNQQLEALGQIEKQLEESYEQVQQQLREAMNQMMQLEENTQQKLNEMTTLLNEKQTEIERLIKASETAVTHQQGVEEVHQQDNQKYEQLSQELSEKQNELQELQIRHEKTSLRTAELEQELLNMKETNTKLEEDLNRKTIELAEASVKLEQATNDHRQYEELKEQSSESESTIRLLQLKLLEATEAFSRSEDQYKQSEDAFKSLQQEKQKEIATLTNDWEEERKRVAELTDAVGQLDARLMATERELATRDIATVDIAKLPVHLEDDIITLRYSIEREQQRAQEIASELEASVAEMIASKERETILVSQLEESRKAQQSLEIEIEQQRNIAAQQAQVPL